MKEFNLLKSEVKKAEQFASKRDGKKVQMTGWSSNMVQDELGFIEVRCEMCSNNMEDREDDIVLEVFMLDRRRTFVSSIK